MYGGVGGGGVIWSLSKAVEVGVGAGVIKVEQRIFQNV